MATVPIFIGSYRGTAVTIDTNYSTRPRGIWTPGSSGSRIHAINAVGSTAGDNNGQLIFGNIVTLQANMGVGHLHIGYPSNDTITRTIGSFITDGWAVGDKVLLQGTTTLANALMTSVVSVAAATLTVGTSVWSVDEDLPGGSVLFRGSIMVTEDIPQNAGRTVTVASVSFLNHSSFPIVDEFTQDIFITLGPSDYLFMALGTGLSGSDAVYIVTMGGDY